MRHSLCLCHRSLTASGPSKFMGLAGFGEIREPIGPSNLGGLRPKVKRPMATATGMAPGDSPEPIIHRTRKNEKTNRKKHHVPG